MPVLGPQGLPDLATISTFFGAIEDSNSPSGWAHVPERIPDNWTNRVDAYDLLKIADEVRFQYSSFPKLFGGNVGNNNFLALNTTFGVIENGQLPDEVTQKDIYCLLYQIATDNVPGSVSNEPELALDVVNWIITQLNPIFANQGCPIEVNPTKK